MPHNLIKKYPELLEIMHLDESMRLESLLRIFDRDIKENSNFQFRKKQIRPLKKEGQASMDTLFSHLINKEIEEKLDNGKSIKKRNVFERKK